MPATCPLPETDQSSPCPPPPIQLSQEQCKYSSPIYVWVLQVEKFTTASNKIITTLEKFPVNISKTFMMLCGMIGGYRLYSCAV